MYDVEVRAFVQFLMERLEADPDEVLEWFFMEHRYGVERREVIEALLREEDE